MKSNFILFLDSNLPREILLARQKFKWYFIEMLNSRWFDNRISISLYFFFLFQYTAFLSKLQDICLQNLEFIRNLNFKLRIRTDLLRLYSIQFISLLPLIYSSQWHHFLQTLHRGTTVLYLDVETHQVALVFLKLERCSGTLTWCRPPWKDPRKGTLYILGQ